MLHRLGVAAVWLAASAFSACAEAQEPAAPAGAPAAPDGPPLEDVQAAIRVRFDRFEETLLKMAGYLQKTEPARAELVLRALRRSKEERVAERMALVSGMLAKREGRAPAYADAIDEQAALMTDLRELLTILRSEDILDDNRKEQERLKELSRQITALIDVEKVHQADTQRGEATDRIAQGQQRTAEKTGEVVKGVDEHDRAADEKAANGAQRREGGKAGEDGPEAGGSESEKNPPEQDLREGEKGRAEPSEPPGENPDGKEDEPGEEGRQAKPPGEPKGGPGQGQNGKPSEGQPGQEGQKGQPGQQGKPQQGQGGEKPQGGEEQEGEPRGEESQSEGSQGEEQSSRTTPGRNELEAARDRMERAIEELKNQNRGEASKAQQEAIQKLIEAKERIEELLRQLREEEREMVLRALEARFQKMLQMQQVALDTTEEVGRVAKERWQDREFARCRDAAGTEREILVEADKALEVLRADGSSVAFPEAVEQIRTDVSDVAARLDREDAGALTVAVEKEIVDALQEMILSLQKEMEKAREKKGQQPGQQGQPGDPSLVDKLAELKMLKTLQLRVNRRTKTLGQLFEGEQATEPEVVSQLRELSERQGRLQRATYDLATGRTAN